jgi:hypothetical protein
MLVRMGHSPPIASSHLLSRLTARDVMTAQPLTVSLETKLSKVTFSDRSSRFSEPPPGRIRR